MKRDERFNVLTHETWPDFKKRVGNASQELSKVFGWVEQNGQEAQVVSLAHLGALAIKHTVDDVENVDMARVIKAEAMKSAKQFFGSIFN